MKPTVQQAFFAAISSIFIATTSFSQTNTLPTSGNVGIGTTSPSAKLQVNGTAKIDSMLIVKDSLIVNKTARIQSDLKVVGNTIIKNDLKVSGTTTLIGNTIIKEGDFKIKALGDSTLPDDGVLMIDANGKVKNGGDLKSLVYTQVPAAMPCATDMNGGYIQTAPFWQASSNPQRMFLINTPCSPDPRLGVGVKPDAKMHVRLIKDSELHPLVIDKLVSNNPSVAPYKLMQLDHTGLLYAREVKVNLDDWADYVFDEKYPLMPLNELQQFIQKNNHLPNVPSAKEMTENGLNVAQSSIMLMEKVEELTLYVLRINEKVEKQEELLLQQQETIRLQQELIQKLEQQVKP
ncbi:hypothetical protein [Fluviicola chungangensis]|uniref:Uncharacterized protein n=1 Tax=Fluviicola chungangensis TaxID=2597671 RepID=A0A556MJA3_9FLAO|nr:hypothetical protein [Fluviicola chungangensis]TSJ39994.1 hypothetical protein FO442_16950 [Fluviicola chungangensis]